MTANVPYNHQNTAPAYGQTLLITAIDAKALHEPQNAWCSLPYNDDDLSQGYEDITYRKLANAINQMAWYIHDRLGPSHNFDTIAYLGTPDIRYHIIEMAAVKTGYKVLFSSHLNSLAGHVSLLKKTEAKVILSASQVKIDDITALTSLQHHVVPELDDLLESDVVEHYRYEKTFEEAKDDPFVILHTSGSTGEPKPIEYTQGTLSAVDHHRALPNVDATSGLPVRLWFTSPGRPSRMLIPFLHFHGISCTVTLASAAFGGLIYIPGFRHKAVATDDIFPILEKCGADTAFFNPAMVEQLSKHPNVGTYISKLNKCLYGGAPVTDAAGKIFSQYTHLQSQWGMTEIVKLVDLETEPEDFAYCGFDMRHSGVELVPVADGMHEMVIQRNSDSYPNTAIFWRCPDLDVFYSGDLWSPHPDPKKANFLWKYQGRTDDLIAGKDGINFHPTGFENKHSEHALVRSAIMAGTGHRQPVLLLELREPVDGTEESAMIDKIWEESVEPINDTAPANGKVAKTHIILASSNNPFERSVKGTVARKATIRKYDQKIESVYEKYGDKMMGWTERL